MNNNKDLLFINLAKYGIDKKQIFTNTIKEICQQRSIKDFTSTYNIELII